MTNTQIFFPVSPTDSSCLNIAAAYHNLATLWMLASASAYVAERHDLFRMANLWCVIHMEMRDMYLAIAMMNEPPPEPRVLIVIL